MSESESYAIYYAIVAGGYPAQFYDEKSKVRYTPIFRSHESCSKFWRKNGGAWAIQPATMRDRGDGCYLGEKLDLIGDPDAARS